jgi:predicted TIM-barrel fold metal-dependent hydrolase
MVPAARSKNRPKRSGCTRRWRPDFPGLIDQLCDIGEGRIANMDAAGIDVQVLSLTAPGVEQLDAAEAVPFARVTNDTLAEAVHRHPDRLAGFAALTTAEPDAAADQLRRTVATHGFTGALINGHSRGRYLDDKFFWPILECAEALQVPLYLHLWPILECAEALQVPLYLHPTPPPQAVIKSMYAGNYPAEVAGALATAAWGWHIDTATHVIRLILSGAFDHYPGLQLVIGHLGETLPFMLPT